MEKMFFQEVYPFATENMKEYFKSLNLSDQDVLTVGSSCDQLFNAIAYGAKSVTVFDINSNVKKYYELKKELLLQTKRKHFVEEIFKRMSKMPISFTKDILDIPTIYQINYYLQNDKVYDYLIARLQEVSITFIEGNLFDPTLSKEYDRIIFSNVLQYAETFFPLTPYQAICDTFNKWVTYLTPNGVLQFLYLYSFKIADLQKANHSIACYNIKPIYESLKNYHLEMEWIKGVTKELDAVLTYTKHRKKK